MSVCIVASVRPHRDHLGEPARLWKPPSISDVIVLWKPVQGPKSVSRESAPVLIVVHHWTITPPTTHHDEGAQDEPDRPHCHQAVDKGVARSVDCSTAAESTARPHQMPEGGRWSGSTS
eukprot:CAMPEP_0194539262 /NCGR_PEP_ID=MMETSP0253-20130528/79161_1 /TAXON_ID=2966 /ORGANISM="Noctiluca scintillans" /LENGTH=118 /DNA_ID=CAMNT_0039385515 /DNA_START=11 /DNA_END=364 /DNA_ORIENTATION=-